MTEPGWPILDWCLSPRQCFDEHMPGANQISRRNPGIQGESGRPACCAEGDITRKGLEMNIDIGLRYLAAWLDGLGCVPIYDLMEDAATAEISRAQFVAMGASCGPHDRWRDDRCSCSAGNDSGCP